MSSSDFSGELNEPGLIVSIDPEHPGKLVPSALQYDKRVAGVISGAGGVRPGMLMGQRGSVADGQTSGSTTTIKSVSLRASDAHTFFRLRR
jgi:hypothetical protein